MEIRSSIDMMMDDTDNKTTSPDEELSVPRPASPCDSEISVGCENESSDPTPPSPMDMTEAMTEDDEQIVNGPPSPESSKASCPRTPARPRSRGASVAPSPQSLSPASVHDEGSEESCSYMSEEEYFRPLKRLAMSDGSPRPPSSSCTRDNMSETMSSPEPSHHLRLQHIPPPSPDEECPSVPSETGVRLDINEDVITPEEESPHIEGGRNNVVVVVDPNNKLTAGLRSFSILDILSYKPSRRKSSNPVKIVRPWDTREDDSSSDSATPTPRYRSVAKSSNNNNSTSKNNNKSSTADGKKQTDDRGSALDALFKMTNKTLDDLNKEDKADAVNLFNNRQPSKKKRKSRTAFTNHQIFELEKRFLYQKYLSPADRDELAQSLGLSNAQVITWFQNRRAKLKRDMEELKRDVETSKVIHNKSLLQASANVVAFLKAKELPKLRIDLASLRR